VLCAVPGLVGSPVLQAWAAVVCLLQTATALTYLRCWIPMVAISILSDIYLQAT
jgi:hypothetical protein